MVLRRFNTFKTGARRGKQFAAAIVFTAIAASISAWSYQSFTDARAAALEAVTDLQQTALAVDDIERLGRLTDARRAGSAPTLSKAPNGATSPADIGARVQQAILAARIPETAIVRITPEAPRRDGNSSYVRTPIRLELRQITLGDLMSMSERLALESPPVSFDEIRMGAPRANAVGTTLERPDVELWDFELTLSTWSFSPAAPSR